MLLDFPLMMHEPASLPLWSSMMITCSGPDVSGVWRYRTQRGLYIVMVGSPRLFPLFCSYFEYLEWKGAYFTLWCPGAHWLIFLWLDLAPFQDWVLLQGLEPCTCSLHLTEWGLILALAWLSHSHGDSSSCKQKWANWKVFGPLLDIVCVSHLCSICLIFHLLLKIIKSFLFPSFFLLSHQHGISVGILGFFCCCSCRMRRI